MNRTSFWLRAGLLMLAMLAMPAVASEAQLTMQVHADGRITGQMRVGVDELAQVLALDADGDGDAGWEELKPHRAAIEAHLATSCAIAVNDLAAVPRLSDLAYGVHGDVPQVAASLFIASTPPVGDIVVDCGAGSVPLAAHPRQVTIHWPDQRRHQQLLSAQTPRASFDEASAHRDGFVDYVVSGVWHIWIGYDHVLFLIALLIPAVLQRAGRSRVPATSLGPVLLRVAAIVTAFTLTHSLTLALAMTGWVSLPASLIEALIAASVAVAALHNLLPTTAGARSVWVASLFGLLHGFGFANVFEAVDTGGRLWLALGGFNLGVELGQLAIVAVFVPLAYALRRTRFYRIGVVHVGSLLVAALALAWLVERISL